MRFWSLGVVIRGGFWGANVKKLINIAWLLVVGLLVSADASAYFVDGGVVKYGSSAVPGGLADGDYIGDIGNIQSGLPAYLGLGDNSIGTHYISDGHGGYEESLYWFTSDNNLTTQWYSFTSSQFGTMSSIFEFGSDVTSFTISFFVEGSDSGFYTRTFTPSELDIGSFNDDLFASITGGNILVKIEGTANGDNSDYIVRLYTAAVPLPPAAILFMSALAGFGVIGRKKVRVA